MRIGVITLILLRNYGGILQAYALRTVLSRMGHEVTHLALPYYPVLPWYKAPLAYAKRAVLKYLLHRYPHHHIRYEHYFRLTAPEVFRNTQRFIDRHIPRRFFKRYGDVPRADYDALVVGSDQIWRPKYQDIPIDQAYLSFTAGWKVKRVAYACSFGTADWEYTAQQTARCRAALQTFDGVSVREESAVGLVKKHFGVDAQWVLDPTMLLTKEDYLALLDDNGVPAPEGDLFAYVLDAGSEVHDAVRAYAGRKGLKVMEGSWSLEEDDSLPLAQRTKPPVEAWLQAFNKASFVITDSFHACVFSILFEKPFVVIGNKDRGMARYHSLLSLFGLEDRLLSDPSKLDTLGDIHFAPVRKRLAELRKESMVFLQCSLQSSGN